MELIQKHLKSIKVPSASDRIYKDECVYSFTTPDSSCGLLVSLTTFLGFDPEYAAKYATATGNCVFLHIKRTRREIAQEKGQQEEVTRLAIGVPGGFNVDEKKYEYDTSYCIVVLPENVKISYPNSELPMILEMAVQGIISAESATERERKEALAGTWDGEVRKVSAYAENLEQLDNGKKIPPRGWKCEKCDLTTNLWLNLTDGSILCGRKFFDGSGGNNHAVEYYAEKKYPLAVKLGTITADGKGDVYSYPEDDMVEDPHLKKHLAHFGINVGQLEKTEKSMVELELDLNQKIGEWGLLTESSSVLEPIYGPGYTGMKNLGNSCYLNSVMQVIFTIPDFIERFVTNSDQYFSKFPLNPAEDFNIQMSKLGTGLLSGKYSATPENVENGEVVGVAPAMFKTLIGKGHQDFSTNTQQDAQEFFSHVINVLNKHSLNQTNPGDAFKFKVEDRVECGSSANVKYTYRDEWCLPLNIPLQAVTNFDEVQAYEKRRLEAEENGLKLAPEDVVRPKIPLQACFQKFGEVETVEQFFSSAINDTTFAKKSTRLATMPDYLVLHLKKFTIREDWTEVKLDVAIDIPDVLDLTSLRGIGLQPDEKELPEITGNLPELPAQDPAVLSALVDMGFPIEACKKAIYFTKNSGLEAATQWMMEHMADNDFGDPFDPYKLVSDQSNKVAFVPNPEGIMMLTSMGFTEQQAAKALKETNNNTERAVDWIFSHQDELGSGDDGQEPMDQSAPPVTQYHDGNAQYELVAFISHMGTSSAVGHYVCHILKDGKWIIFNDEKVALSQNPPKELAYLYLYKRSSN
uniref:Ubiquitin carboxyl-terminal hydrolase n=1 Tax=Culicoides sonorensis TaxID=179676 RepID=A0A336MN68_CULSO